MVLSKGNNIVMPKRNVETKSSTMMSCFTCFSKFRKVEALTRDEVKEERTKETRRKPGWKAMPYILGNETFERLATIGLLANFLVYLQTQFHLKLVAATNLINIWSGCTCFIPILGAFLSDTYLGRFRTIAVACISLLLGMGLLTFVAWNPQLHPSKCTPEQLQLNQCPGPTPSQFGALLAALVLLAIGPGGIRPCSIPFGVDQFDHTTEEGRRSINSFFNWYYATYTVVQLIALTLIVYIQNSVSWVLGFAIQTCLVLVSIILFFFGTRIYVYVKPEGSLFTDMARVFVAAFKKRKVKLPDSNSDVEGLYYDPPLMTSMFVSKIPLTNEFSIQKIEEAKCLFRVIPVWASGIICYTSMTQIGTFTVTQALKMDRHVGPKFQIPPGSVSFISMVTIGIFVPIYDRILVPLVRRVTHHEGGITILQRMGIGTVFYLLSTIVAGLVETARRDSANAHNLPNGISPMSVFWLSPQLVLVGFAEAFFIIGQIEFNNKQFPENMRSIGNTLFPVAMGIASYLSSVINTIVHATTGRDGHPDWLANNINEGKLDCVYYIISVLGLLNLIYFLIVARRYKYKAGTVFKDSKESTDDTELMNQVNNK